MGKKIWTLAIIFILASLFLKEQHKIKYVNEIKKVCKNENIDIATVLAIAKVESGFRETVVSKKGAVGMMQIMPSTAKWIIEYKKIDMPNYNLKNYKDNIRIGVIYYKSLYKIFNGDVEKSLAAYNAGPSRVVNGKWKKIEETRKYVEKVMFYKKIYDFFY